MKALTTFTLFLSSFLSVEAQTSVTFDYTIDSTQNVAICAGSDNLVEFYLNATSSGYNLADEATFFIDFGDGTDTIFTATTSPFLFPSYFGYANHTYSVPGLFDVTYMVTMPDLNSDTILVLGEVLVSACDTISGYVYYDENANCVLDGIDSPLTMWLTAQNAISGDYLISDVADATGYYELVVPAAIPVEVKLLTFSGNPTYLCTTSNVITAFAPSSDTDFPLSGDGYDLIPLKWNGYLHPGYTTKLSFGVLDLNFFNTPDVELRIIASNPLVAFEYGIADGGDMTPEISGDTISWSIPAIYLTNYIAYYGCPPEVFMWFYTDTDAPAGSQICFDVIAEPVGSDLNPTNNKQTLCFDVLNSLDPNFIEVEPKGITSQGLIDPNLEMSYTIHFQNTGNFPAVDIVIKDTLDYSVLDTNTFQFLGSSHPLTEMVSLGNGIIEFHFDNIYLPDSASNEAASHGWVKYQINQQPNLNPGTTIENTAAIYFDFNPAVITNTVLNTIIEPLQLPESTTKENSMRLYPIPASEYIRVVTNSNTEQTFQITDINGQLIMTGSVSNGDQIAIDTMTSGIYFLRLENGNVERLIIQD